ncbi:DUF4381 family protein [Pseudoxanthomonas sp. SGNA-20]|uniref:DUF4381 family protein n=1 Tax=Pseudoxanthomonas sp. SGNA-20 TaxID=2493088 RepID=UPI000F63A110|nr:DUF4381 family protein [Pseudoxanthomonas sp. SGNA-20]RRN58757.1 DUF4381 family protein [Pseudoxanthomonas sp. SGNA-20]
MDPARLPLRDLHLPPAPGWWPPAPGWWWLGAGLLVLLLALAGYRAWRWRRRRRWSRWFLRETGEGAPPQRLAQLSALLRRAARQAQPGAERLQGEDWLRFLDGARGQAFSAGPGRLLLDGAFRPQADAAAVEQVAALAHARFLELMDARRGRT